jgi:hypothetical protein
MAVSDLVKQTSVERCSGGGFCRADGDFGPFAGC